MFSYLELENYRLVKGSMRFHGILHKIIHVQPLIPRYILVADVAEWLRRLTRNQFLSESVGSNPTVCV